MESLPGLLGRGFVLPSYHLVLGEHLAFPHPRASRHRHFIYPGGDATIGEGGAKLVKCGEVGRDARGGVPLLPLPVGLVLKFLGRRHLDRHFLS